MASARIGRPGASSAEKYSTQLSDETFWYCSKKITDELMVTVASYRCGNFHIFRKS
jgi:hypothetical protein